MAGRDGRRHRERGDDSEREALRSRKDASRYRSRTRDTDRDVSDSEQDRRRDRERQARREDRQQTRERRDRTRDPESRRPPRTSESRDAERRRPRASQSRNPEHRRDRTRDSDERTRQPRELREHTAEPRDRSRRDRTRHSQDHRRDSSDRTRVRELSEREFERTRERAVQDRERLRKASRPVAALELDTESEDELAAANAAAETRGLNRTRRQSRHPPRPRRRSPSAPAPASVSDNENESKLLPSKALAVVRRGAGERTAGTSRSRSRRRQVSQPLLGDIGLDGSPNSRTGIKRRVVSGAYMEEGNASELMRGGASPAYSKYSPKVYSVEKVRPKRRWFRFEKSWFTKKRLIIIGIASAVLLIIIIVVAVVVSNNNNGNSSSSSNRPSSSTNSQGRSQVPTAEKNTDMDPWSWYDTTDFNMTYTNVMVGDLPIIGLYSDWDDSPQANSKVPALDKEWGSYSTRPARGVNLGGWLSLEPFITPSLFSYSSANGIIDEYTLTSKLGGSAKGTLEKHYATFITESDFKAIADAGLDHVRIPFSYWAIEVYDDEPYLHRTSWRYLLRGLEWARKYGLRVNLDVHGLPGSQNGWNHSGRQGAINWLNGTNGATNAQRSLDIHDRLSKFFSQDRYKNLIAFYGLANEPRMTALSASAVVNWTEAAYKIVQGNGIQAPLVFGDGFMGLENWKGVMTGYGDSLILDVHQYVIFDENLIVFTHADKIKYACKTWTSQAQKSSDTSTGFGPTMFAEWSQADTDCARHLTNVGWGNRWEGTYDTGVESTSTLSPSCPAKDSSCRCAKANADASDWNSAYKDFLKDFAEAQMHGFERGWGWWYWTWKTESAPQWSYQAGLAAGVLPAKAYERDFDCSNLPTSYPGLDENY
ncbi:hypothetical protein Cpir12675_002205 [Ceratocystis pirilliformis]|uniref:glucan 1,3-beta-glucosidase n=1 Tax=Ceratocystis pirilliformis TaxID=259994 RepID=A0ABR3ZCL5_9PEZI